MAPPLFVYGTLKRSADGMPHRLLRGARFTNTASIFGELYDLGTYPGVYRNGSTGRRVYGELFELPPSDSERVLKTLDQYEGPEFIRRRVFVTLRDGRKRAAWAYLLRRRPDKPARQVNSGRHPLKRGAA